MGPNIIFYPGGLVDPASYSPLARTLAEQGHRVYIAKMPLNLAIFGQNKADSFIAEHPDEAYVIGGHSLGGAFASAMQRIIPISSREFLLGLLCR